MPQERKVHDVKWEKQDTVPYMQYDLNCEIFIHLKKKKRLEENASLGFICFCRVKSQDFKNHKPFTFKKFSRIKLG